MIRRALLMLSLALTALTVGLWVSSHFVTVHLRVPRMWHLKQDKWYAGIILLEGHTASRPCLAGPRPPVVRWSFIGFSILIVPDISFWPGRGWTYQSFRRFGVPYWSIALLVSLPAFGLAPGEIRERRRRRRMQARLCVKCGYDLTGNESGVCPECGEAI